MRTLTITEAATVAEIDEALDHARQLPQHQRGEGWHTFVDRLLELRATHKTTGATPIFSHKDRETTGHKNGGQNSPGTTRHHPV
jgi:hypothetical protein